MKKSRVLPIEEAALVTSEIRYLLAFCSLGSADVLKDQKFLLPLPLPLCIFILDQTDPSAGVHHESDDHREAAAEYTLGGAAAGRLQYRMEI